MRRFLDARVERAAGRATAKRPGGLARRASRHASETSRFKLHLSACRICLDHAFTIELHSV